MTPRLTEKAVEIARELMTRDGLDTNDADQVSRYVERMLGRQRFFLAVADARRSLAHLPQGVLERMIDEAVEDVEASHRG